VTAINIAVITAVIIITPRRIGHWFNEFGLAIKGMGVGGMFLCGLFVSKLGYATMSTGQLICCRRFPSTAVRIRSIDDFDRIRVWDVAWNAGCRTLSNAGICYCFHLCQSECYCSSTASRAEDRVDEGTADGRMELSPVLLSEPFTIEYQHQVGSIRTCYAEQRSPLSHHDQILSGTVGYRERSLCSKLNHSRQLSDN
jgi:hypothetical protein